MTKHISGADKIHEALSKLKDEANAKEVELIELVTSVYEKVKTKQEEAVGKVKDTATAINTSVHLHPWHFIGGAALCGFLIGRILRH